MSEKLQEIPLRRIDGSETRLADFKGNVLLVVNVASQCGLTPQYSALQSLYERFRGRGFAVLGFPANEFGAQEPGSNGEIAQFCETNFSVTFPMFEKIVVKGDDRHPLYDELIAAQPAARQKPGTQLEERLVSKGFFSSRKPDEILWNFEKFVVGRNGEVVARFAPDVVPDDPALVEAIEAELAKS
ncbi:MAG TPA: glutathione peroxidase [Candidatus Elarobacter sp.]|jgi:glutathione peroxidase|nr:glutathione peroxidase [Candidatus Elarobacter sp.]